MKIAKLTTVLLAILFTTNAFANNIAVSNVMITGKNTVSQFQLVNFDVSWDNSWRTSSNQMNWDAAWVFVKFRKNTSSLWQHATMNYVSGSAAADGHTQPTGSTITTPADGKGVFIYRNADGSGSVNYTGAKLRWNYGADGLLNSDSVTISVMAIEMVYIPQGQFYAGDGASDYSFYTAPTATSPYLINSENSITIGNTAGNMYYASGTYAGDRLGPIPNAFPKGYNASYAMKYEISQQQYADFLNCLSSTQAANRYAPTTTFRYTIAGTHPNLAASAPDRACNFINWTDFIAYGDWSGLRPMSELEYEKIARGANQTPVPFECAWGNTTISPASGFLNSGANNETGNAGSNVASNSLIGGPIRVGAFASATSNRQQAGASYYGVMELSGNLVESTVTVGNPTGRAFTGNHGDGNLDVNGDANVTAWPLTSLGGGYRGGHWNYANTYLQISDRYLGGYNYNTRSNAHGGRLIRTAP
jgi:formylglycine-generating enzyme required for sulfatase activity